jgi:hypothetical protein
MGLEGWLSAAQEARSKAIVGRSNFEFMEVVDGNFNGGAKEERMSA